MSTYARHGAPSRSIVAQAAQYRAWLVGWALPLWTSNGLDPDGWFHESLDASGDPQTPQRRARVQPRQVYCLCLAAKLGWDGPWRALSARAMAVFEAAHGRLGGGYRTVLNPDGSGLDDRALIYDLAFALLARAGLQDFESGRDLLEVLDRTAHPQGGYIDPGDRHLLANPQMHLFEAFLAWEEIDPQGIWCRRTDALARLALDHLIEPRDGILVELYDPGLRPAAQEETQRVEPGHLFEWAHLLATWSERRADPAGAVAALTLYDRAAATVDRGRNVAVDALDRGLAPVQMTARLWPQTERLKAALSLGRLHPAEARRLTTDAQLALDSVWLYLRPNGTWADVMDAQGQILPGPAPASSFYHVMTAFEQLALSAPSLEPGFALDLTSDPA